MKKEIKEKLNKLENQYHKIGGKIREIKDEEIRVDSLPALKKLVGTCFKYLNSYGGDREKWFLYSKIISIDESTMTFICVEFQKTSMNRIEIEYTKKYSWNGETFFSRMGGYIKVPESEYNRAKKSLYNFIDKTLG